MAPTSPIKRITRARAAKSTTSDMNELPKRALAAKPAGVRKTKAASKTDDALAVPTAKPTKKSTTKSVPSTATIATAPRRRVKVTPLVAPVAEEVEQTSTASATTEKPAKTRKTAANPDSKSAPAKNEASSKARPKKIGTEKNNEADGKTAPKTRGRPKKTADEPVEAKAEPEKPIRQTRRRAESDLKSTEAAAVAIVKSDAVNKKKVTFQDLPEDDKENQPIPSRRGTSKKESTNATGIRARPVRKPATMATRKKAVAGKAETQAPRALTPKKITQVARSATPVDSDEDELNGGKTPIRDLSQSPKRSAITARSPSPVKKLDFTQTFNANSPMKSSLLSPPRRLPQSPFKNSFKESPKRGEALPVFPTLTATLGVSASGAMNVSTEHALQQSPKRGVLDSSIFAQSTAKLQRSPNKPFLSQSPMRGLFSPVKQSNLPAADKPEVVETAASSFFRSSQSPLRSVKVHRMSDEELAFEKTQGIDFDESILKIRSPVKVSKAIPTCSQEPLEIATIAEDISHHGTSMPSTPRGPWTKAEEAEFAPPEEESTQTEAAESIEEVDDHAMAEGVEDLPRTTSAASYLFDSYTVRGDDESSEDELQADETPQRPLFGGRPSLSTKTIRARLSSGLAKGTGSTQGFTPLATQLSGWLASSPEKQSRKEANRQRGIFSPLAGEHVPGEVQVSRQSTPGEKRSASARKSIAPRSSLAPTMSGSPMMVSSLFADEMVARDLEEQMEARVSLAADCMDVVEELTHEDQIEGAEVGEEAFEVISAEENPVEDFLESGDGSNDALSITGVIDQPTMTETAMLDFVNIAQEAEELASAVGESPHSSKSSEYGDENTVIITRQENSNEDEFDATELPSSPEHAQSDANLPSVSIQADAEQSMTFKTPARLDVSRPRFVNTVVSKIPLKPEGHISPIKIAKKRSRSLSAGLGSSKKPLLDSGAFSIPKSRRVLSSSSENNTNSPATSIAASTPGQISFAVSDFGDSTLDAIEISDLSEDDVDDSMISKVPNSIKSSKVRSTVATPVRTPLKAVGSGVLHGAVVYVDVHTTEGADASGIFVDLLTQMGARCVREWKWNSRASLAAAADDVENTATAARIGITHVVYKDGGKRTLEKVRDAKGEVCCIGVGWVLDCEREGRWLDESTYAVDPAIVPRGGSRRRKSMEPRALINANGSLSASRGRSMSAEMTKAMKEELINTPIRRPLSPLSNTVDMIRVDDDDNDNNNDHQHNTDIGSSSPASDIEPQVAATTPTGFVTYDPATSLSPKTPYLMKEGAKLVQASAPPKQSRQGLFPITGEIADQPDENARARLEVARRRTMNWRPRVASPLGK